MDTKDREKLKALICSELESIGKHIKQLEERCQPVSPDNAIGRISRMEAISERGVYQTALVAARTRFHELNVAVSRIDNDEDYGLCQRCDAPIPLARLMLMPESRYCVKCLES